MDWDQSHWRVPVEYERMLEVSTATESETE